MITEITGTITHDDGQTSEFRIAASGYPAAYHQWGNDTPVLGRNVDVLAALVKAVRAEYRDPEDRPTVPSHYAGPRYKAEFHPQAWVRDDAVEVDPEGDATWDCTAYAVTRIEGAYLDDLFAANAWQALDNEDRFKDDPNAPEWVRRWSGPFSIYIERQEG